MKHLITVVVLTAALVLAGAPAHAAPAKTTANLVTVWPASTTVSSPKTLTAPYYHNGRKTVVETSRCASGVADQGTFYRWARISGGFTPLWSQPVYFIKCR